MKLIIIHGPPAAGKLTVATDLADRTGFKLFHNHVSIDCVKPVFEFGTPPFMRMIELIRFGTIAEAARENVSLIHTFVYALGEDDEHFTKLISAAEDNGGEAHLVLLRCGDERELHQLLTTRHDQVNVASEVTREAQEDEQPRQSEQCERGVERPGLQALRKPSGDRKKAHEREQIDDGG